MTHAPFVLFAGFAFVTFEREETVDKVVDMHYHDINNKTVSRLTINLRLVYHFEPTLGNARDGNFEWPVVAGDRAME
jgi:hypothetical protein